VSYDTITTPPTTRPGTTGESTTETAKHVATQGAHEAKQLGGEALDGARQLLRTGRTEVRGQLQTQTARAAEAARTAATQLLALANGNTDAAGRAQSLVRDAGDRLQGLAEQLDREGVDGLTRRASDFARRRPVVFLGGMALAGFLAGRYAKVLSQQDDTSSSTPILPPAGPMPMAPPPVGSGSLGAPLAQAPLDGPTGVIASGGTTTPTAWTDR